MLSLLYDLKNYIYNLGFYISTGIFIFSLCNIFIFLKWGILNLKRIIFQNIPNRKLKIMLQKNKEKLFNKGNNKSNQTKHQKLKILKTNNIKNNKKKHKKEETK